MVSKYQCSSKSRLQKYKIYICVHLNHIWLSDLNPDCKNTKYTCVHLNPFCSDSSESSAVMKRFNTYVCFMWWCQKNNIYIVLNAYRTSFWSFYVFRRRASRFEITLHKTLSLNDEFNDTTWKKESATRLQTRALHTKTPFCH